MNDTRNTAVRLQKHSTTLQTFEITNKCVSIVQQQNEKWLQNALTKSLLN